MLTRDGEREALNVKETKAGARSPGIASREHRGRVKPRAGEHGGDPDVLQGLGIAPSEVLDFSANINPLGVLPAVQEAIHGAWGDVMRYPDPFCRLLTAELARFLDLPSGCILATNGASELIWLLFLALRPRRVLLWAPSYVSYARAARMVGSQVKYSFLKSENDFRPDLDDLLEKARDVDLIVLGHPHNPTGSLLDDSAASTIINYAAERGIFLAIDESFIDLAGDATDGGHRHSLRAKIMEYPRLVIIYSLTKSFAIPGLRLGCGMAAPALIDALDGWQVEWSVNSLAQAAGIAALRHATDYLERARGLIATEREYLTRGLQGFPGLHPYPAAANFLLVGVGGSPLAAGEWWLRLARRGILVRDCRNFAGLGDGFLRLAVRSRPDNERLLAALRDILATEVRD